MRRAQVTLRWLTAAARSPALRFAFFSVLALAGTWPYLRTAGAFNDFRDAQVLWLYEDAARRSVIDFWQLPLWNPDFCGGLPALGTPQSRFASPTFILTLLFGTTRAEPVTLYAMLLIAHYGAHGYLRERRANALGATLGAPVFGLMGLFACAPFLGWFGFLGFALLPWALTGTRRCARGEVRGALLVAGAAACMVGFGGTYVAPISAVACALELVGVVWARRGRVSVRTLAVAALLTLGLSAFRLWPVWEELHRAPRVIAGGSGHALSELLANLFGTWPMFGGEVWYLVGGPAGWVTVLALGRRRAVGAVAALGAWLWLAAGYGASPSAFGWLRLLPMFSMLRSPERFLVPATLVFALGAAWAVTDVTAWARLRPARRPRLGLALAVAAVGGLLLNLPVLLVNFHLAADARGLVAEPSHERRPFHQARGNRWAAASFGPMSRGSLACWEAYPVPQSPLLRGDLAQESWLGDASAGTVEERGWSPQRLDYKVTAARATTLVVNQNYHPGWKSSVGAPVSEGGLLAVALPSGEHEVTLRFAPTSALGGLAVSALTALVALWLLRRGERSLAHRGGAASLALAASPLAVGLGLALASGEPAVAHPEPAGPEGEPVVAAGPPPGARLLDVRFAGGVSLEAASVTYRPADDRVRVEFDWKHEPGVTRSLGFFVHLEPGTQKRISADHAQLSDALFLEEGPAGATLRDVLLIDVPQSRRNEVWSIWVGVWKMRGDGARLEVVDANGAKVEENRVLVGTVSPGAKP